MKVPQMLLTKWSVVGFATLEKTQWNKIEGGIQLVR